jgi:hypothetical protein
MVKVNRNWYSKFFSRSIFVIWAQKDPRSRFSRENRTFSHWKRRRIYSLLYPSQGNITWETSFMQFAEMLNTLFCMIWPHGCMSRDMAPELAFFRLKDYPILALKMFFSGWLCMDPPESLSDGQVSFACLSVPHFKDHSEICCRLIESDDFYGVISRRISLPLFIDRFGALCSLARSNVDSCKRFVLLPLRSPRIRFWRLRLFPSWSLIWSQWMRSVRIACVLFLLHPDTAHTVRIGFLLIKKSG